MRTFLEGIVAQVYYLGDFGGTLVDQLLNIDLEFIRCSGGNIALDFEEFISKQNVYLSLQRGLILHVWI